MRVAVIGTGRMAEIRSAALASAPEADKVVVVSDNAERRTELAGRLGVDHCDLPGLESLELDAVMICTQSATHHGLIRMAARRRVPAFCEKPVALTLAQTQESITLMDRAGTELQVGFHRRFDPEIRRIRECHATGKLGQLYLLRSASHDRDLPPEHFLPTSGGIWRDLHVHDFDLIRWMTGEEIDTVFAHGAVRADERFARHGDSDTTTILATTSGGLLCVVTGTRHDAVGYDVRLEVMGSAGSLAAGIGPRQALDRPDETRTDVPWTGFAERFADAYTAETHAFVRLASGSGENRCPGESALGALRAAIACELSMAERRVVSVSEIGSEDTRVPAIH